MEREIRAAAHNGAARRGPRETQVNQGGLGADRTNPPCGWYRRASAGPRGCGLSEKLPWMQKFQEKKSLGTLPSSSEYLGGTWRQSLRNTGLERRHTGLIRWASADTRQTRKGISKATARQDAERWPEHPAADIVVGVTVRDSAAIVFDDIRTRAAHGCTGCIPSLLVRHVAPISEPYMDIKSKSTKNELPYLHCTYSDEIAR